MKKLKVLIAVVTLLTGLLALVGGGLDLWFRYHPSPPADPPGKPPGSTAEASTHPPDPPPDPHPADPPPTAHTRPFQSPADVLTEIAADLDAAPTPATRRYLSLAHLSNNPRIPDADLDRLRQALPDLADYLNLSHGAAAFQPIDADKTVYRFTLDDFGWDGDAWTAVLKRGEYPYGLTRFGPGDARDRADGCCVRADWFLRVVAGPPLGGPNSALHLGPRPVPPRVQAVADAYGSQRLDLAAAAVDLGLSDPTRLQILLRDDRKLRDKHGLGPLLDGDAVRRDAWESTAKGASPFQELSRDLGLGKPVIR